MDSASGASPPFVHFVRVGWGDCDPARIAFTGRLAAFALEAIDAWWEHVVGADWYRMNIDRGVGTPFVHMTMDFRSPVTPRHRLACEVALLRLGSSSVRLGVRGRQDGKLCFEGQFVQALLRAPNYVKFEIPEDVLAKLRSAVVVAEPPWDGRDEPVPDGRRL
jgi:4-hydroxybenzoyl-CoA thioesterase